MAVGITVLTAINADGYDAGSSLLMQYDATGETGVVTWLAGIVDDANGAIAIADPDTDTGGTFDVTVDLNQPGPVRVWVEARDAGSATVARNVSTVLVHHVPDAPIDADQDIGTAHLNRLLRADTTTADVTLTITDGPAGLSGVGGYVVQNWAGANDLIVTVPAASGWFVNGVLEDSVTFAAGQWGWVMPDNYLGFNSVLGG